MRFTFYLFLLAVGPRCYYGYILPPGNCPLPFDRKHDFLRELLTQLGIMNKHNVSFKVNLHLRQF